MFIVCAQYRNMVYLKRSGHNLSNVLKREAVKYDDLIGRDGESSRIFEELHSLSILYFPWYRDSYQGKYNIGPLL